MIARMVRRNVAVNGVKCGRRAVAATDLSAARPLYVMRLFKKPSKGAMLSDWSCYDNRRIANEITDTGLDFEEKDTKRTYPLFS